MASSHHERRVNKCLNSSSNNSHRIPEGALPKTMVVRSPEQALLEKMGSLAISAGASSSKGENNCGSLPPESAKPSGAVCAVCHQETPALTHRKINAVTQCKHVFCYECALRLLFISVPCQPKGTGIDCPICRQHTEHVFLTGRQFASDSDGGDQQVKDFVEHWWPQITAPNYDSSFSVAFFGDACMAREEADEIMDYIDDLMVIRCSHCDWTSKQMTIFKRSGCDFHHFAVHFARHQKDLRFFCKLCFDNLQFFPLEMAMYSESELSSHLRRGSHVSGDAFVRHQRCTLCWGKAPSSSSSASSSSSQNRRREGVTEVEQYFFDEEALLEHAKKEHLSCYVCAADRHTFYRDVEALKEHIDEEHYACTFCRDIAFGSVAELRAHVEQLHPENAVNAAAAAAAAASATASTGAPSKKSTKKKHQPLVLINGVPTALTTSNNNNKHFINFEVLERREIARKTTGSVAASLPTMVSGRSSANTAVASSSSSNGSAATSVIELDSTFRQAYAARQSAHPPSFEPKANSETYALHFPTMGPGAGKLGEQVNLGASVYAHQRSTFASQCPMPKLPPPEMVRSLRGAGRCNEGEFPPLGAPSTSRAPPGGGGDDAPAAAGPSLRNQSSQSAKPGKKPFDRFKKL